LSYRPRSSLPIEVLRWLSERLAQLCPARRAGQGGTPLPLEVRLDALGAVVLDGLSYRRAARMVGICKTEVGDSLDLLLGELAALGLFQPDGTFVGPPSKAARTAGGDDRGRRGGVRGWAGDPGATPRRVDQPEGPG
jgi:hypothetical protein